MEPIQAQMVFCCAEQWMGGLFHHIEPWGDGLRLGGTGAVTGVYCLPAVDSGENGFAWDRVLVEADLPCAIMVGRENCEPDFPNLSGWRRAQERPVATWDENDLGLEAGQVGLAASPTQVVATDVPQRKKTVEWLADAKAAAAVVYARRNV